jgi:hypothetical protein
VNFIKEGEIMNSDFFNNPIILQNDEQVLLNKIFSEYYKQLKMEQLSNQDRVMTPYFEEAITKLFDLARKLKVTIYDESKR